MYYDYFDLERNIEPLGKKSEASWAYETSLDSLE